MIFEYVCANCKNKHFLNDRCPFIAAGVTPMPKADPAIPETPFIVEPWMVQLKAAVEAGYYSK